MHDEFVKAPVEVVLLLVPQGVEVAPPKQTLPMGQVAQFPFRPKNPGSQMHDEFDDAIGEVVLLFAPHGMTCVPPGQMLSNGQGLQFPF